MGRIWSTLAAAVAGAVAAGLVVVLVGGAGGAAPADAAPKAENAAPSNSKIAREQKAINKRLRTAILRANNANKTGAANTAAIAAVQTTPGPPGTPGTPGTPGVAGTPGTPGVVDPTKVTVRFGTTTTNQADGGAGSVGMTCAPGEFAIAGGFLIGPDYSVEGSQRNGTTGWTVTYRNTSGGASAEERRVEVICVAP